MNSMYTYNNICIYRMRDKSKKVKSKYSNHIYQIKSQRIENIMVRAQTLDSITDLQYMWIYFYIFDRYIYSSIVNTYIYKYFVSFLFVFLFHLFLFYVAYKMKLHWPFGWDIEFACKRYQYWLKKNTHISH